jgi:hypothetical protein
MNDRWCYRVLAYVALMTDEYRPFRLDTGGEDPGTIPGPAGGGGPPDAQVDLRQSAITDVRV